MNMILRHDSSLFHRKMDLAKQHNSKNTHFAFSMIKMNSNCSWQQTESSKDTDDKVLTVIQMNGLWLIFEDNIINIFVVFNKMHIKSFSDELLQISKIFSVLDWKNNAIDTNSLGLQTDNN